MGDRILIAGGAGCIGLAQLADGLDAGVASHESPQAAVSTWEVGA